MKQLLLGSTTVGEDALIRFYLLHVAVLPITLVVLLSVHIWRIRKDGGLSRPGEDRERAPEKAPIPPPDGRWRPGPTKTYGLMAVVRGRRPNVDRPVEDTVPTWPHVLYFEAAVLMLATALCVIAALIWNAPLKEMANPAVPENPAKAPWYFLGLQELVAFSAFAGGVALPGIAILGLALIPFLDRERGATGVWFGGADGRKVFWQSLVGGSALVLAVEAFCIRFGWLRQWFPDIPQLVITLLNPGTVIVAGFVAWSLYVIRRSNSTRLGALALFTCFLVGFVILTVIGTYFRGPNWDFYWSRSQWPLH
jgi:quinol-cytochrome oxidoreductase complex cytochrome b subunit